MTKMSPKTSELFQSLVSGHFKRDKISPKSDFGVRPVVKIAKVGTSQHTSKRNAIHLRARGVHFVKIVKVEIWTLSHIVFTKSQKVAGVGIVEITH